MYIFNFKIIFNNDISLVGNFSNEILSCLCFVRYNHFQFNGEKDVLTIQFKDHKNSLDILVDIKKAKIVLRELVSIFISNNFFFLIILF
jgi:hypothetical protein